jgi:hypothetical protein
VDEVYLIESIKQPNAKIVEGYTKGAIPMISLNELELDTFLVYIKSLKYFRLEQGHLFWSALAVQ